MKLSILDSSPISTGESAHEALETSKELAVSADKWGYTRYWMTEHHAMNGFASSAPEVLLSYIGAHTNRIRLGTGAVLLPYYKPYKVAEVHHTLASLFPGRIDMGIGRAPGGPAEASNALSDHFLQQVRNMPGLVKELMDFLHTSVPGKPVVSPLSPEPPKAWLLGTSEKSALLAAEQGMLYAYADFMSDNDGTAIIQHYRDQFKPGPYNDSSKVIVAASAVCAETSEKAEDITYSGLIRAIQKEKGEDSVSSIKEAKEYAVNDTEAEVIARLRRKVVAGTPSEVAAGLKSIQSGYQADEIMIITTTILPEDRLRSYELLARRLI